MAPLSRAFFEKGRSIGELKETIWPLLFGGSEEGSPPEAIGEAVPK